MQNESGLIFPQQGNTSISAYVGLINENYDFHGKTIDIDIVDGDLQKTINQHARIFSVVGGGYAANAGGGTFTWRYNTDPGWSVYASDYGWGTSLPEDEYPLDFFNQKTLRLEVDALGFLTVSVAPLGTENFIKVHTFEKRMLSPGYLGYLVLGSSQNNDLFPFTVSGVRIYENASTVEINKYVKMNFDMLIMGAHYFEDVRVIDIADLRSGSEFDLSFMLENALSIDGALQVPDGTFFEIQYLDKDFKKLSLLSIPLEVEQAQLVDSNSWSYTFEGNVPRGAQYMYFQLICSGMQVEGAEAFTWMITALNMAFNISALEEQSKTQQQILDKLDKIEGSMDDYINGNHGFDPGGSDFSGAVGDLNNSQQQMGDAMSGGMNALGGMMGSPQMLGTLTTLGSAFDAVFEGHEITICGVTANPFTLLVSILAIAVLIPLALKYVFRKRGGGSGG